MCTTTATWTMTPSYSCRYISAAARSKRAIPVNISLCTARTVQCLQLHPEIDPQQSTQATESTSHARARNLLDVLQERCIKYGFTIAATELSETIPTLWNATQAFMTAHAHLLPHDNLLDFVTGARGFLPFHFVIQCIRIVYIIATVDLEAMLHGCAWCR